MIDKELREKVTRIVDTCKHRDVLISKILHVCRLHAFQEVEKAAVDIRKNLESEMKWRTP